MNSFSPVLTQHLPIPESHRLETYQSLGGYAAVEKVLRSLSPQQMVDEVKASGLRGRGGAGFPTGMKWGFIPKGLGKPTYLICNADESEPGTFKDRLLMDRFPHMVLEGIILASYAIGCHRAFIYIRGEFFREADVLEEAIAEARRANFLGERILGTDFDLEVVVHRGAGAYICGEETGLIESLEGKRGWPRKKPPFPAVEGYLRCPTVVNNVETLACLPHILNRGAAWFKSIGPEKGPGPKLFCVSGHVQRPGVFEEPMGILLTDLVFDRAGGMREGRRLKAVFPGGSSSALLTAAECEGLRMDFDSLASVKSMLGSAGVIVMDDSTDMVRACLNIARFYAHESCGQCTPCREGTTWLVKLLCKIQRGEGRPRDLDLMLEIPDNIGGLIDFSKRSFGKTICPFGEAVGWPVRSLVEKFREEFEVKIRRPAVVGAA